MTRETENINEPVNVDCVLTDLGSHLCPLSSGNYGSWRCNVLATENPRNKGLTLVRCPDWKTQPASVRAPAECPLRAGAIAVRRAGDPFKDTSPEFLELARAFTWAMKHVENVFALAYRYDREMPNLDKAREALAALENK